MIEITIDKDLNLKFEALISKQKLMNNVKNSKHYDLEERTLNFAKKVRELVKKLPITTANLEDGKQLIRTSGSIGANYIEANDSFSKKDFILRLKIARKEAKETIYWLELIDCKEKSELKLEKRGLVQESKELMLILSSIIKKLENHNV